MVNKMVDCIRPGEVTDDDLIGYAADESPRLVRDHVRACPRCAKLAKQYAQETQRLGHLLFRFDCPSSLELGEYHLNLLPASIRQQIDAHLALCPHCTAELATADSFLETPLVGARPPQPLKRGNGVVSSLLERLVAQLIPAPMPAMAVRGRKRSMTLLYQAGDIKLTLHPQPADRPRNKLQLLGFVEQVNAPLSALTGTRICLLANNQQVMATTLDSIGNFVTGPISPGIYDLELTTPTVQVIVPELELSLQ